MSTVLSFSLQHQQLWVGHVLQATAGERKIAALLTEKLSPTYLEVRDISGLFTVAC